MSYKCMVEMWFVISMLCYASVCALGGGDLVIVILSQAGKYHMELGEKLRNNIETEAQTLNKGYPIVHLSHVDFPHVGGWTIIPLIQRLTARYRGNCSWIFFVEDRTQIRLNKLVDVLDKYNANEETWLGYGLHDNEATIIHHFAFSDNPELFKYPNIASGFAISERLMLKLASRLERSDVPNLDFSIDNAHELALFIWDKGAGHVLQHEPTLCISDGPHCATYPEQFHACGESVPKESIYFAVKTCKKFHNNRVPVVKNTWAKRVHRIGFFSDVQDDAVPTISLGIPNTENGHCGKTVAIIKYVANEIEKLADVKWIVIADDDTILSVSRLQQLLTCYDASSAVAIGERYGYNVHNPEGYNYITGGGGMVFSRNLLEQLSSPGSCVCPSVSSPDDMYLGICIARLGISVTHSPLFHQARPVDYAPGYLESQAAVSFHKHWMIDPLAVYEKWFLDADLQGDFVKRVEL